MNNYSIDASVYAFQFKEGISDPNEIYSYYKTINDLYEVIIEKQPRNKKFYLFLRDIELINDFDELNLIEQDISLLDQMLKKANIAINSRDTRKMFETIITRLNPAISNNASDNDRLPEKVMFENWFNIEDIKFKDDKY